MKNKSKNLKIIKKIIKKRSFYRIISNISNNIDFNNDKIKYLMIKYLNLKNILTNIKKL